MSLSLPLRVLESLCNCAQVVAAILFACSFNFSMVGSIVGFCLVVAVTILKIEPYEIICSSIWPT